MKNLLFVFAFVAMGALAFASENSNSVNGNISTVADNTAVIQHEEDNDLRCTICIKDGNDMYCGSGETCSDAAEAVDAAIEAAK